MSSARRRWLERLRLAWATFCLLGALLIPFPAQTYLLWQLSILATEFSIWLGLAALIALLPGWARQRTGRIAAAFAFVALLIALSPIVRATAAARQASVELSEAFGGTPSNLFSLGQLLRAQPTATVAPKTLEYARGLALDLYPPAARAP